MALNFGTASVVAAVIGHTDPDNPHYASEFDMPVTAATWASNSVTYTVTGDTQVANGSTFSVTVSGMTPSAYNGTWTATVVNAARTQFRVSFGGNPGTATVFGTAKKGSAAYTRPSIVTDTRRWDVFAADLAFPYDGHDGYTYCFLGDTFGADWNGPNVTHTRAGNTTIAAGSNGVVLNTFTGTQNISLAAAGSFTTTGGYAVVQLASNGSALAYIKYNSRTSTTLSGCTLVYAPDPTKALTTGDVVRGDDGWTGAGWRSNTLFRHSDTDLSNGITIESFRNLQSPQNFAKQAIPGVQQSQVQSNAFAPSRPYSSAPSLISGTTYEITTGSAHRFTVGQTVTAVGTNTTTGLISSIPSSTKLRYTTATSPTGTGTVYGYTAISSIVCNDGVTVDVTTGIAHGFADGQSVLLAGTGVRDGEYIIDSTSSTTTFRFYAWGSSTSATTGTVEPATNSYWDAANPGNGVEGTVIPTGAIALESQSSAFAVSAVTWSGGSVTLTTSAAHSAYVGEQITVAGLAPSSLNGTFVVTGTPSSTQIQYALANPGTITDQVGTVQWTRHYCYYMVINYFSTLAGQWFVTYMGIAYSDDKGNTWTREGVSGASYQTVDPAKVWVNNDKWTDNFQQAWPVDGGDGYVYSLCTRGGRFGDAFLMRVAKANILTKSSYTYWDGSTWNSAASAATAIYTGYQAEPTLFFHTGTNKWLSTYLYTDPVFGPYFAMRSASSLTGPWSDVQVILTNDKFGNQDAYGGWIHPWSNTSPQASTDFYFMTSLFAPYATFLLKSVVTGGSTGNFFRFF